MKKFLAITAIISVISGFSAISSDIYAKAGTIKNNNSNIVQLKKKAKKQTNSGGSCSANKCSAIK